MERAGLRRRLAMAALLSAAAVCGCRHPAPFREKPTVRLVAVGDVLLARGVGRAIARHGSDYPFEAVMGSIGAADLAFCNLECTLSQRGTPQRRRFRFRADPALAANLRRCGFDIVSVANNHTMDFGRDAFLDTLRSVRDGGMIAVGGGRNRQEALAARVVETNGLKVGFLAYTDIPSGGVVRLGDRPTVAGCNREELPDQIRRAKARCDVLVVSFHWGIEYMRRPTERQKALAHLCVDNGANLILGHHPHVLQPVEIYRGKPVLYSMGAFVWDPVLPNTDRSAIYSIELTKDMARLVDTRPVRIVRCRPEPESR